jgi:hypothetical protein
MNSRLDAPKRHATPSVVMRPLRNSTGSILPNAKHANDAKTKGEFACLTCFAVRKPRTSAFPSGLVLCLFAALLPASGIAAPDPASPPAAKVPESKDQPAKPAVLVSAEENLAKVYLKLPSRKLVEGSNGDADGLLRAVPWRSIGESAVSTPQVRFSFGAEFKRGSTVAAAMAKAGEAEPFFVEQRVVQATAEDCKALLRVIAALEAARFEKPPENIKYRAVAAGYGDFRFRKMEDGKVEMFAYVASVGEIWAPVELPALKKLIAGLIEQLEAFGKSPQTIFLK